MIGSTWLTQCVRDVKAHKIHQTVRTYSASGVRGSGSNTGKAAEEGGSLPVRTVVATSRIHRGEHIATVKQECVLTGQSATQLLQRACRGSLSPSSPLSTSPSLQPLSVQPFDQLVRRIAELPIAPTSPPHLLLTRDALLMATALYVARSPLHSGTLHNSHPMRGWVDALPRRPPPMAALLYGAFTRSAEFAPLPRRLRLGTETRTVGRGEDLSAASTELMVQAVESGAVALADLRHPSVETALTESVLTNYFAGRTTALTSRQHATQRARSGAAEAEQSAVQLFVEWEQQLESQFVQALLPVLLTPPSLSSEDVRKLADTPAWQAEEAVLRWAHFTLRSRCVNLNWRRPASPLLSLVPLVDMLNHGATKANVVYYREDGGDVTLTAAQAIEAGEELVLRYNHAGQRGCLFGDFAQPTAVGGEGESVRPLRGGRTSAAVARAVGAIERQQYADVYTRDDDEEMSESVVAPGREKHGAALAHREMTHEVKWLWRYGFLRSTHEKNREAGQRWNQGLRRRIAHLTDVRRKGRPGEFVIGVPEGLQHLREQRAELERERYANHRVFPPQQP